MSRASGPTRLAPIQCFPSRDSLRRGRAQPATGHPSQDRAQDPDYKEEVIPLTGALTTEIFSLWSHFYLLMGIYTMECAEQNSWPPRTPRMLLIQNGSLQM